MDTEEVADIKINFCSSSYINSVLLLDFTVSDKTLSEIQFFISIPLLGIKIWEQDSHFPVSISNRICKQQTVQHNNKPSYIDTAALV